MKFFIWLITMTLTACTPTLAPQPVHTVNPASALTKRHTDELPNAQKFDVQQIVGKWTLQKVAIVSQESKAELLKNLDNKTHLTLIQKDGGQLAMSASIGCNAMSAVRQLDGQGNLSNAKNAMMTSTLKSCGELSDRTESRFGAFLWETKQIGIVGGVLSLTDKYGNVLTFVKRTKPQSEPQSQDTRPVPEQLSESLWVFSDKSLSDPTSSLNDLDANAKVSFSEYNDDNLIGIRATVGCNNKSSTIKIDNNGNISRHKGIVIGTLIGCGDKINQMEADFVHFVANAKTMSLDKGRLVITSDKGDTLTFIRQN